MPIIASECVLSPSALQAMKRGTYLPPGYDSLEFRSDAWALTSSGASPQPAMGKMVRQTLGDRNMYRTSLVRCIMADQKMLGSGSIWNQRTDRFGLRP